MVKGMALKWGRGTQHPKAQRWEKKQGPIDCWQRIAILPTIPVVYVNVLVAVAKGTKAVTSGNFSVYGRRTFNNLRTNFAVEIPEVAIRDGNVITEKISWRHEPK